MKAQMYVLSCAKKPTIEEDDKYSIVGFVCDTKSMATKLKKYLSEYESNTFTMFKDLKYIHAVPKFDTDYVRYTVSILITKSDSGAEDFLPHEFTRFNLTRCIYEKPVDESE